MYKSCERRAGNTHTQQQTHCSHQHTRTLPIAETPQESERAQRAQRVRARAPTWRRGKEKSQPTNEKFSQEILIFCFIRDAHTHAYRLRDARVLVCVWAAHTPLCRAVLRVCVCCVCKTKLCPPSDCAAAAIAKRKLTERRHRFLISIYTHTHTHSHGVYVCVVLGRVYSIYLWAIS